MGFGVFCYGSRLCVTGQTVELIMTLLAFVLKSKSMHSHSLKAYSNSSKVLGKVKGGSSFFISSSKSILDSKSVGKKQMILFQWHKLHPSIHPFFQLICIIQNPHIHFVISVSLPQCWNHYVHFTFIIPIWRSNRCVFKLKGLLKSSLRCIVGRKESIHIQYMQYIH